MGAYLALPLIPAAFVGPVGMFVDMTTREQPVPLG